MSTRTRRFSLTAAALTTVRSALAGATAAADDLAVVVLGHRELEDDRAVVLLELLDLHRVGLVDQRRGQVLEQLPHGRRASAAASMPWVFRSFGPAGRLGARPSQCADALLVEHDRRRLGLRVVLPDVSMKRPSRGERWSATTTRQMGSFLPPTRVSRMLDCHIGARPDRAIRRSVSAAASAAPRSGILPCPICRASACASGRTA